MEMTNKSKGAAIAQQMERSSSSSLPTDENGENLYGSETPAYKVLRSHHLLNGDFAVKHVSEDGSELGAIVGNSNAFKNAFMNIMCCPCSPCFRTFTTKQGMIQLVEDGRGNFLFYGAGVHLILDPFYTVHRRAREFGNPTAGMGVQRDGAYRGADSTGPILHGDRTIVVVEQGFIGFALDKGQPVLLPPGLHQWKSATMQFIKCYDLNNNVIRMGPLTLVTVDEGYAAVTEDNGQQKILGGGDTYLLTHRNWKFQKYITQKIQSNDLKRIKATSADNVLMAVDATVIWRIEQVDTAARMSADTIQKDGRDTATDLGDITKLSNDVLKQSEASLAAFIGAVNYSDTFNVAAAVQAPEMIGPAIPEGEVVNGVEETKEDVAGGGAPQASAAKPTLSSPLFDPMGLKSVVKSANDITCTYGVRIISINVVAAVPADAELMNSLAQGAVAAAEAQKYETVARGRASAAQIEAAGAAEANIISAKGDAAAELLRAEGARKAADLVSGNDLAVKTQLIDKTGTAIQGAKATMFFGVDSSNLGECMASSAVATMAAQVSK